MTTPTYEDFHQAFLAHRRAQGLSVTTKLLIGVAGVENLDDVPEGKRAAVIAAMAEGMAIGRPKSSIDPAAIFARWNGARRPAS